MGTIAWSDFASSVSRVELAVGGNLHAVGTRHYRKPARKHGEHVYVLKEDGNTHDEHAFGVYAKVGNIPRDVAATLRQDVAYLCAISAFKKDDRTRRHDFTMSVLERLPFRAPHATPKRHAK